MIRIILILLLLTTPSYAMSWKDYRSQSNISDFSLCPLFYKMGKWESYKKRTGQIHWFRDQTWISGTLYHELATGINDRKDWSSSAIISNPDRKLVYVGPWYEVTLTYPQQGFLKKPSEEVRNIKKSIRLIAWQRDTALWAYFEEKEKENAKIKEMDLDLWGPIRGGDMSSLCYIKYSAKYNSYNAKPETIRKLAPGILNKLLLRHEILVTGKIIEVKE